MRDLHKAEVPGSKRGLMSWRPQYRSSKFRNVYGKAASREQCFDGIPITKNVHDNHFCAVNARFLAIVTESAGGGSFLVIPLEQTGRIEPNYPKVCGHQGNVLDIKWNPFIENIIASCSEDTSVRADLGDPGGGPEAEHDGGGAGAVRAQPPRRPGGVAPHHQQHPLQRRLRLQGADLEPGGGRAGEDDRLPHGRDPVPVLQHGRQPDGHHLQGQAAARGGAALRQGPAGGQLQEPPRQPRGFPGKHQTAPDHRSVPLEHPADRALGPGGSIHAPDRGGDRWALGAPLPVLRRRHPHAVPGWEGRRQHPVLRDRLGEALPELSHGIPLPGAAERAGGDAEARPGRLRLRSFPFLQTHHPQGAHRAHLHDRPEAVGDVPGGHLSHDPGHGAGPDPGRVAQRGQQRSHPDVAEGGIQEEFQGRLQGAGEGEEERGGQRDRPPGERPAPHGERAAADVLPAAGRDPAAEGRAVAEGRSDPAAAAGIKELPEQPQEQLNSGDVF